MTTQRTIAPLEWAGVAAAAAAVAIAATAPAEARAEGCQEPRPALRSTELLTSGFRYLPGDDACGVPRLTLARGSRLMYSNFDFAAHDVRSFALRKRRARHRRPHRRTGEPLFSSELVRYLGRSEVVGVAALEPGTYGFYCTIHPPRQSGGGMHGTLIVDEAAR